MIVTTFARIGLIEVMQIHKTDDTRGNALASARASASAAFRRRHGQWPVEHEQFVDGEPAYGNA